jgi:predicted hydrocarbon binding protein
VSLTPATVHSLIPLSLLEAIRNLDTPLDDGLHELAGETVSKRLGLSATVAQQIERYRESADRNDEVPAEEAISVFRLVGRRPDATLVYSDAGRRAARYAARAAGIGTKVLLGVSPKQLRRQVGARSAAKVARRFLGVELELLPSGHQVRMTESLATQAGFPGSGCYFYSAVLAELLRMATGFEGAMVHARCHARGDDHCFWRAAEAKGYE